MVEPISTTKNLLNLTIAIPTKNEAKHLQSCLESIGKDFAKEIIIVDSNSKDGTIEIAENFGIKVIQFNWNGKYPKKRNWFLQNYKPATQWVLFLDADETLTDAFKTELAHKLPKTNCHGFWLNYSIYLNGKMLKAGYPLKKLALFNPNYGLYEKIEEDHWTHLDMEIHEHPIIEGLLGEIKTKIDHKPEIHDSFWKPKHLSYAKWEAKRLEELQKDPIAKKQLSFKQKIKYQIISSPLSGILFFLGSFILLGGWIDGKRGWIYAKMKYWYFNQVYIAVKTNAGKK